MTEPVESSETCLHCFILDAIEQFQKSDFDTEDGVLDAVAHTAEALAQCLARIEPAAERNRLTSAHAKRLAERVADKASKRRPS